MGIPIQQCVGLKPTYWTGQEKALPDQLTWGLITSGILLSELFIYWRKERATRHVPSGMSREEFMKVDTSMEARIPSPKLLHYIILYVPLNYAIGWLITITFYLIFAGSDKFEYKNIACYQQYYNVGDLLYGVGVGFIITSLIFIMCLYINYFFRAKKISAVGAQIVQIIVTMHKGKHVHGNSEGSKSRGVCKILHPVAFDACLTFSVTKMLQKVKNVIPESQVAFADKYGFEKDQLGMHPWVPLRNAKILGVAKYMKQIIIQPEPDVSIDDRFQFPLDEHERYDYVFFNCMYVVQNVSLGSTGKISSEDDSGKANRNRLKFFLAQVLAVMKPDGCLIIGAPGEGKQLEDWRSLLSESGFASHCFEHEDEFAEIGVSALYKVKSSLVAKISTKLKNRDDEASNTKDVEEGTRGSIFGARASAQVKSNLETLKSEGVLVTQEEKLKIFSLYVLVNIAFFAVFMTLFLVYYNDWYFPSEVGFGNYFNQMWQNMTFGLPSTIAIGLVILYFEVARTSHATSADLHRMGLLFTSGIFVVGTITVLPGWAFSVIISYYLIYGVLGIPTNTVESKLLVAFIFMLFARVILAYIKKKFWSTEITEDRKQYEDFFENSDEQHLVPLEEVFSGDGVELSQISNPVLFEEA
jgi:hypothetical protein